MIALRIQLLTGRYVATAYNDRSRAEWPPHPARVFSALVATHYSRPEPPEAERKALQWLEAQDAPALTASLEPDPRDVMTRFVPVNDTSVHSMPDRYLEKVEAAETALSETRQHLSRAETESASKKAQKAVEKAEKKLDKAQRTLIEKNQRTARPASRGGTVEAAVGLLPTHRTRQPRTLPSVTPADDVVWLIWGDADPPEPIERALGGLASDVSRIGHSSSLVAVSVATDPPEPTLVPDDTGNQLLRVPGRGQLAALDEAHARHQGIAPRILPALHQTYREPAEPPRDVPASVFGEEWIVLARTEGPRLPPTRTADIARALRGAMMAHAQDPPPPVITGRTKDGNPSDAVHLAYVPLPFIGAPHADGSILGVALVLPRNVSRAVRRQVARALGAWEAAQRQADEPAPELELRMGRAGVLQVKRQEGVPSLYTLRSQTWCGAARRWATATPIALDRNPGELRHRDPAKAAEAADRAEEIIARSATYIGLPEPRVRVLPAPPLSGARKAQAFPAFPRSRNKTQRVLTHAVLEFPEPVRGPVILGAGRFRGLGLCRPLRGEA